MQDSRTPARSAVIAVFTNVVLNLTLVWFLGTGGLAAATAICSYLQVAILIVALRSRFTSVLLNQGAEHSILDGLAGALVKTSVATICMSAAAIIAMSLTKNSADGIKLLLTVPSATAVYLLAAKFLRIEMLSLLTSSRQEKHTA